MDLHRSPYIYIYIYIPRKSSMFVSIPSHPTTYQQAYGSVAVGVSGLGP